MTVHFASVEYLQASGDGSAVSVRFLNPFETLIDFSKHLVALPKLFQDRVVAGLAQRGIVWNFTTAELADRFVADAPTFQVRVKLRVHGF
jgi:hypothetical protein